MENIFLVTLDRASLIAEQAVSIAFDSAYNSYPEVVRLTYASAAVLHCDILRYLSSFQGASTNGIERILWMGDIASMLYEARTWFFQTGNPNLLRMAKDAGMDVSAIRERLRDIKRRHPLSGVESFETYRNKVGSHYDADFVKHLQAFSEMDSGLIIEVLSNYAKYSGEWISTFKDALPK